MLSRSKQSMKASTRSRTDDILDLLEGISSQDEILAKLRKAIRKEEPLEEKTSCDVAQQIENVHTETLENEIAKLRKENEALNAFQTSQKAAMGRLETMVHEIRKERDEFKAKTETLSKDNRRLKSDMNECQSLLEEAQESIKALYRQYDEDMTKARVEFQEATRSMQEKMVKVTEEHRRSLDHLESSLAESTAKCENLETHSKRMKESICAKIKEIPSMILELDHLEIPALTDMLINEVTRQSNNYEKVRRDLARKDEELEGVREVMDEQGHEIERLEVYCYEAQEYRRRDQEAEAKIRSLKEAMNQLECKIVAMTDSSAEKERETAKALSELKGYAKREKEKSLLLDGHFKAKEKAFEDLKVLYDNTQKKLEVFEKERANALLELSRIRKDRDNILRVKSNEVQELMKRLSQSEQKKNQILKQLQSIVSLK